MSCVMSLFDLLNMDSIWIQIRINMPACCCILFFLNPENINRDGRCKQSVTVNMPVTVNTINGDEHLKRPDNRDGQMSPPRLVTINRDRVTATGSFARHG